MFPCALGRGGISHRKREGDGATPVGTYALRKLLFRPDRLVPPRTGLPRTPLTPADGWCDAPRDRNYNRSVRHPYPASAERMWREDGLYDLVVVIGYNDTARITGRGSAIFMHVARDGFTPTEGCIALRRTDLIKLVARLGPKTRLVIR
jgi:L,D-peptidoglycan transpeptidase YkuD (ErfK/YbiS/YcfS/YnhG family)